MCNFLQDSRPSGNGGSFKYPPCSSRCCWVSSCACELRHKISHWAVREAAKSPPNRPLMRFEDEKKAGNLSYDTLSRKMNEAGRNEEVQFTFDVTAGCFPTSFAQLSISSWDCEPDSAILSLPLFRVVEAPICL